MGRYADASYLQYESHLQRTLVPYSLANVAHALTPSTYWGPWQRPVRVAPATPGDARTARRRIKAVELSAVFQSKQRAEKGSREDGKSIANRTQPELGSIRRQNRPLFPQVAPPSPHARAPAGPARASIRGQADPGSAPSPWNLRAPPELTRRTFNLPNDAWTVVDPRAAWRG